MVCDFNTSYILVPRGKSFIYPWLHQTRELSAYAD